LIEGNLTLATALIVKDSLEAKGAIVMLTRSKINETSFGMTYHEWLKKNTPRDYDNAMKEGYISLQERNRFISKGDPKDVFQNYFKTLDLKHRADLINSFAPDLTLVIHYNVDETNTNWTKPTNKNFNMVFIPGNIKPEYLKKESNRFEFLRLAVSDDLDKSAALGSQVIQSYKLFMDVPIAKKQDAKYLREESLETSFEGVFIRNLVLTRLIHGPMVYGETLYQDNIQECKALNNCTIEVHGMKTSGRVKDVALAYYQSILNYYAEGNK
jgi:N-acetylmuramoyl-L-alanine amidase